MPAFGYSIECFCIKLVGCVIIRLLSFVVSWYLARPYSNSYNKSMQQINGFNFGKSISFQPHLAPMKRCFFLKIFIGLSVVSSTLRLAIASIKPSPATCRIFPNEEYALDPYRCQEHCENYGDPSCPDYAPDGDCYCKRGYLRLQINGKCVSITSLECRAKLPPTKEICARRNEYFREYLYDEPCPNTCENLRTPCVVAPPNIMVWSPHCACKEGFSRLPNGNCVPIDDPECLELWTPSKEQCIRRGNEIYDWGSTCQVTCEEIVTEERVKCTYDLILDCYCPDGKVRLVNGGECVDIENCFPVKYK